MEVNQQRTTQNKLSLTSLFVGIACLVWLFIINAEIANSYLNADRKTKLWFWITEMTFNYKYYILLPALVALILGVASSKRKENRTISLTATILSLLAIASVFLKFWKVMV